MRDKAGNTPFAKAMAVRDDEAGRAILKREPKAAEQVNYGQAGCLGSET